MSRHLRKSASQPAPRQSNRDPARRQSNRDPARRQSNRDPARQQSNEDSVSSEIKRPTMHDVAAAANVSISAVSIAMRNAAGIGDKTRDRILKTANALGYQRNRAASLMKLTHTGVIGITLDPANRFHIDLAQKIPEHATKVGRDVIPAFIGSPTAKEPDTQSGVKPTAQTSDITGERRAITFLQGLRCDGLILLGPQLNQESLTTLAKQCALTLVGYSHPIEGADVIHAADDTGQREVVSHLIKLGHRDIIHVDGGNHPIATQRRNGYKQAMQAAGLADNIRVIAGGQSTEAGQRSVYQLVKEPTKPTAICAFNDEVALGIYDTLFRHGLGIPTEISLTGYDNTATAKLNFISLPSVAQRPESLTQTAIETVTNRMAARIAGANPPGTTTVIQPDFIARESTAPPRKANI